MANKRVYVTLMLDIDNEEVEITEDTINDIVMDYEDTYNTGECFVEVSVCGYREE